MPSPPTDNIVPLANLASVDAGSPQDTGAEPGRLPWAMQYGLSVVFVAVAVVLAFVVEHLLPAQNLTLIFVLPVVIAATMFGWGPALAAVVMSVLAFDFFFTEPRLTFAIASPSDIWAAGLLLVTAAIVSAVAAESRRRGLESRRAAAQASALHALAHVVIEARPPAQVIQAAARALSGAFGAPAVVFVESGDQLKLAATAGGAQIRATEEDAARGALFAGVPMRAETYPHDESLFDFWPIGAPGARCVLGVQFSEAAGGRPSKPEQLVEIVGGYLTRAAASAGVGAPA